MIRIWLAALTLALLHSTAGAFPDKPIQYTVPFPPGGESDIVARFQQDAYKKMSGKDMVILNKAGAGGGVAWGQLNQSPADGHHITSINLPHIILQPLEGNVTYKTDDIVPVYFYTYTPDAIVVPADSPVRSLADLIKLAREKPGAVSLAGTGTNTANHLAAERLSKLAGVKFLYVPFKGTGDLNPALLGGHVNAAMGYSTTGIQLKEKIRMLAIATPKRLPQFPDVPTFRELGYDWVDGAYRGVAVPKTTPPDIRRQVSELIGTINRDPDFRKRMVDGGFELIDVPLDGVDGFMKERSTAYIPLAKSMGLVK